MSTDKLSTVDIFLARHCVAVPRRRKDRIVDAEWLAELRRHLERQKGDSDDVAKEKRGEARRLAKLLGVTDSTITKIKKGQRLSPALVVRISRHYGMSLPVGWFDEIERRWIEAIERLRASGAHRDQVEEATRALESWVDEKIDGYKQAKTGTLKAAEARVQYSPRPTGEKRDS